MVRRFDVAEAFMALPPVLQALVFVAGAALAVFGAVVLMLGVALICVLIWG